MQIKPEAPKKTGWPPPVLAQDDCSPDYMGPSVIPPAIAACQRNERNMGFGQNCNLGSGRGFLMGTQGRKRRTR